MSNETNSVEYGGIAVDGINVAYREAGDRANPKLVLLHGFPSSSHQHRDLIRALSDRFHLIAPDYPGFGLSDTPEPGAFAYTFDRIAEVVGRFLTLKGFLRFGLFVQDYGGPIGLRLVEANPDALESDIALLQRPHAERLHLDLFYDYRTNVPLYPRWQAFLRERQPQTLIFWGQGDLFFTPAGGDAYLADVPSAEIHRLDAGHFAVEEHLDYVAKHIERFYSNRVSPTTRSRAA